MFDEETGYNFTCPQCGEDDVQLEEVMGGVTVRSEVNAFDGAETPVYGEQWNADGEVLYYQCENCGWQVEDEGEWVHTSEQLYDWLVRQGGIEEKDEK